MTPTEYGTNPLPLPVRLEGGTTRADLEGFRLANGENVDRLRELINRRQVVVVAGAGVSAAASCGDPLTSWGGLLESGIVWCETNITALPEGWGTVARSHLALRDPLELIFVAEMVTRRLQGRDGKHFRAWLHQTVGSLKLLDSTVPGALGSLGIRLTTATATRSPRVCSLHSAPASLAPHAGPVGKCGHDRRHHQLPVSLRRLQHGRGNISLIH